ncbi:hypothetical protein HYDPIDRAFT_70452, partial [Hydnomerulius pinastri MD-312]
KSSCSNHRAVNVANASRTNLQATGIGATACAGHGCFVPHSVSLNDSSTGIGTALVIYDIACQWSIHFKKHVEESPSLAIPEDMIIVPAVGKFHLSSQSCMLLLVQAMSAAHHQETYDAHVYDSNYKKMI